MAADTGPRCTDIQFVRLLEAVTRDVLVGVGSTGTDVGVGAGGIGVGVLTGDSAATGVEVFVGVGGTGMANVAVGAGTKVDARASRTAHWAGIQRRVPTRMTLGLPIWFTAASTLSLASVAGSDPAQGIPPKDRVPRSLPLTFHKGIPHNSTVKQ